MQIRNPQYTADGRIDCEIEHPRLGWIPFTSSPHDEAELGRAIYAAAVAAGPAAYQPPPAPSKAEQRATWSAPPLAIMRVLQMVAADLSGVIDPDDGNPPPSLRDLVEGALSDPQTALSLRRDWPLVRELPRLDPLVAEFATVLPLPEGMAAPMMDMIWPAAMQLDAAPPGEADATRAAIRAQLATAIDTLSKG